MWKLWKVNGSANGFALLEDAPDALGAGGDPALDDAGDSGALSEDVGDGDERGEGDADDADQALEDLLVDGDDDEKPGQTLEDTHKALKAKNRQIKRQLAKRLGTLKRVEGLDLDQLIARARQADQFEEQLKRNPRLRRAIYGDDEESAPARGRDAARAKTSPADDDAFDESKLPFDPNESEANRYVANLAKELHEQKRVNRQLAQRLDQVDGRDTARTEATEKGAWRSAIDASASHIADPGVRTVFKDAVTAAFRDRKEHGLSAQQIVAHYLKVLNVTPAQATKAQRAADGAKPAAGSPTSAAARQRIAERNQTLPRTVAPSGTPTTARTGRERLADVHRRVRQQLGGTTAGAR